MAYFRTPGGLVVEIDPPRENRPHAVQLHAELIAKGELVEVDASLVEEYEDQGATKLRLRAPEPEPEPAPAPVEDERAALLAQADALGITVDGRWGNARIAEAIASATPQE